MPKRYQVFVSSTFKDLQLQRQTVMKALLKVNAIPAGMEWFPPSDSTAWELIKRNIDTSDYYMVIVAGMYGSIDDDGVSYTEREFDYAVSKGIPVFGVLHREPDTLPRNRTELDPAKSAMLEGFRKKVRANHCGFWENDAELMLEVMSGYHHLLDTRPAIGWVRGDEARTVEDLQKLVAAQEELFRLREEVGRLREAADSEETTLNADTKITVTIEDVTSRQHHNIQATWYDVFYILGNCAADLLTLDETQRALRRVFAAAGDTLPDRPSQYAVEWDRWIDRFHLTEDSWAFLRIRAVAYGLVEVDHRRVSVSGAQDFTEKFLRLTESGKRFRNRVGERVL